MTFETFVCYELGEPTESTPEDDAAHQAREREALAGLLTLATIEDVVTAAELEVIDWRTYEDEMAAMACPTCGEVIRCHEHCDERRSW